MLLSPSIVVVDGVVWIRGGCLCVFFACWDHFGKCCLVFSIGWSFYSLFARPLSIVMFGLVFEEKKNAFK